MKNPTSYEDVMKELEEVNDQIETELDNESEVEYNATFKFEYAFESITERNSSYKRRVSHV